MKHSNIRNVIVNIMAHELCVINNHVKYINDIFLKIDSNHNGSLSHREIYNVLSNAGVKKWDINRIIQALDVNDKGCITYTGISIIHKMWFHIYMNIFTDNAQWKTYPFHNNIFYYIHMFLL